MNELGKNLPYTVLLKGEAFQKPKQFFFVAGCKHVGRFCVWELQFLCT